MTETNQNAKLEEEPMATSEEAEAAETAAEEESATKADAEEQKRNAEATPAEEGGDEKQETDPKTEEKAAEAEPEIDANALTRPICSRRPATAPNSPCTTVTCPAFTSFKHLIQKFPLIPKIICNTPHIRGLLIKLRLLQKCRTG